MVSQNQISRSNYESTAVVSVSPVILPVSGRMVNIEMRISAPIDGEQLPVILLSHGHGQSNHLSSLNGNLPLMDYWASKGFVVIQPTHLDSKTLNLGPEIPGYPLFCRSRVEDMKAILDQIDYIENSNSHIKGRIDRERIAIAGLSLGGFTASLLLGANIVNTDDGEITDLSDSRIKAGVLLSAPGNGKDLNEFAATHYPFLAGIDFKKMNTPTLVVWGDADVPSHQSIRGADWHADPYYLSNGPKSLLTLYGSGHLLGGISGYDAAETTDESPERVAIVQQLTTAYLYSVLYPGDLSWKEASRKFMETGNAMGKIESKN